MRTPAIIRRLFGPPLSCEDVNHFIVEYLDDALPDDVQDKFEKHVARCENCAAYLEQYKQTIALVKEADDLPPPPPELAHETLTFLDQHLNGSGSLS